MSDSYDWMEDSNEEAVKKAKQTQKAQYARKRQKRLWLPVGAEKEILILDDTPKMILEHNPVLNGTRKGNWFTCIKKLSVMAEKRADLAQFKGGCPLCAVEDAYSVGFVTALVLTPFVLTSGKDKGKELVNYRNLWPLKLNGLEWFNDEKRRRKSLIGCIYALKRNKKQGEPAYGQPSFIEKVKDIDDEKFHMVTRDDNGNEITAPAEPLKYGELLAPMSHFDLKAIAEEARRGKSDDGRSRGRGGQRGYRSENSDSDHGDDHGGDDHGGDDDIPF